MNYKSSPGAGRACAIGLLVALLSCSAMAQDEPNRDSGAPASQKQSDDKGQYYQDRSAYGPIQRRKFQMKHEISFGWSYLPLDAYYKGYGLQLAYTIHLNPLMALELFRIGWSYNIDTSLKNKVLNAGTLKVNPEDFPAVVFYENTNFIFNVLYGKSSFLNRMVLHFELFVTGGGTFIYRNPFNIQALDMDTGRYDLGINGGLGFRVWVDPDWSIRFDLRDMLILLSARTGGVDSSWKQVIMIGLMASYNL
jgi:outer membrane beta-barrel protein